MTVRNPLRRRLVLGAPAAALAGALPSLVHAAPVTLLNVSYDVAREFYKDYNKAFAAYWKKTAGEDITLNQSHGGSSKQARAVIEGLDADVITMNQALDIDVVADKGLIAADWAKRLPNNAAPTSSVTMFMVRKGNPKGIKDWSDLAKPGMGVVIPNPKVTGNGRYTYLGAWGSVIKGGGNAAQARELVQKIFANVPVFDGGGRAATTTFAQRSIGDVLCTFESEVQSIVEEFGNRFDVVYPARTVLAENPVAVVDKVVDRKGTRKQAEAYLKYLWSEEAQRIAVKHNLRPRDAKLLAAHAKDFPNVSTFTVDEVFGSWKKAQAEHFNDGGIYDQIMARK
ncbi:sulfate ABC transporter substrate-binding protein [Azohydromonas caseinilytica]|uniref:Sulfate ABC transporter substrate-binding protein n=1 Tax=Azohydromonas caseinilytica TaxID=2728836 RepID=A0A848FBQ9_9BURK|nr:sulfate ABC transporter substrate-binding protein [Azohydromonas caseinilytica]NML16346.1 sulfate ABC transporter substrate-binding protein [Azohydromonas caseinilytica]